MRIQVNLSDEMVEKLNDYSKQIGVPRSSLCAVWLGQNIAGLEKAMDTIGNMYERLSDQEVEPLLSIADNKVQE